MERSNQMLIEDIKREVMAELRCNQKYANEYQNRGYQAYCQLVATVKQDVLHQLKNQGEWRQAQQNVADEHSGFVEPQLTRTEIDLIKREVIRDLQIGMDGENQRMPVEL